MLKKVIYFIIVVGFFSCKEEKSNTEIAKAELPGSYFHLKEDNIKWKNISNTLKLELQSIGNIKTTIVDTFRIEKIDTVYYSHVADWSNKYLSISNARIEKKELFMDYEYRTGISIFQEPKKKGTIVTVSLTDKKASIISANSFTVTPKKTIFDKWWLWTTIGNEFEKLFFFVIVYLWNSDVINAIISGKIFK